MVKQQYHYLHWWRNNTTCIVIACSPYLYHAPRRRFGSSTAVSSSLPSHPGAALGRLGVRVTNQPTWCWARCSSAVRELPRGQVCLAPWAAQGSVSVTMVSRVCSVTMVAVVACTPFGTGGYPARYQCGGGVDPNVVALGHLVRVPLYQVTLLASSPPRCTTPPIGSLVTPSVCLGTSPLCLPAPVYMMCDVSTCVEVARCYIGTHVPSHIWFPDHVPSCGSGRAQKDFVAVCGFDTFQHVSATFVMCFVNIMSDGFQCVFVLLGGVCTCIGNGLGHCCASKRSNILTVCFLMCFLIGVVLAPTLVTTMVSRRYSVLWVWSQRTTHCSDKPRT